jgi:FkbM family methyltransferase
LLRTLAERLSRGLVFRRRLPPEFGGGRIFVSPESGLRFYRRSIASGDATLFKMAGELVKPGDVVWDVGANVGLFTFAAAYRAGKSGAVIAIEPDTWLASLLQRSCELRERDSEAPVTVISAAVSDQVGLAKFHIAARSRSSNHLEGGGSTQSGGARRTEMVITITLDWLLQSLPSPRVLKVDVEALEHRVLAGATTLLSKVRPVVWCEVNPVNQQEVTSIFRAHQYQLFYANQNPSERQSLSQAPWDTLAVPLPL